MNKLYHGFVLLFCGACCTLSLVAWKKSADSGLQKIDLGDRIGLESLGTDQSVPAPSRLSPRMIRAFEQAHQSKPISDNSVVLASWAPDTTATTQPKIVSVSDMIKEVTLNWKVVKTKKVWLVDQDAVLELDTDIPADITSVQVKDGSSAKVTLPTQSDPSGTRKTLTATFNKPGEYGLSLKLTNPVPSDPTKPPSLELLINNSNPDVVIVVPGTVTSKNTGISIKRGQNYDWEKPDSFPTLIQFYVNTLASLMVTRTNQNTQVMGILGSLDSTTLTVDQVQPFSGEIYSFKTPTSPGSTGLVILESDPTAKKAWVFDKAIELNTIQTDNQTVLGDPKIGDTIGTQGVPIKLSDSSQSRTINFSDSPIAATNLIQLFLDGKQFAKQLGSDTALTSIAGVKLSEGNHSLFATLSQGDNVVARTNEVAYQMQTGGFRVLEVSPKDFGIAIGSKVIEIKLSRPLAITSLDVNKTNLKESTAVQVKLSPSGSRNGPFSAASVDLGNPSIEVLPDRQRIQINFTSDGDFMNPFNNAGKLD
ncbi:MAG: hypothetical protein ACKN85_14750, partial [Pirellula sp.]